MLQRSGLADVGRDDVNGFVNETRRDCRDGVKCGAMAGTGESIVTSAFETECVGGDGDWLAHNPEVAFGPVPAQRQETALAPVNRTLNDRLSLARRAASSRACSAA